MSAILDWIESWWSEDASIRSTVDYLDSETTEQGVSSYWAIVEEKYKKDARVQEAYARAALRTKGKTTAFVDPIKQLIQGMLHDWVERVQKYDMSNPAKAEENLAALSAEVLEISAGAFVVELGLGAIPFTQEGPVSSARISQLMAWLGFGATINAIAHDPVKIGILRPYQDSLEATFRNRRPEERWLTQAFSRRIITKDAYDNDIAKWGYSQAFADVMAQTSYRAISFFNLKTIASEGALSADLAKQGLENSGYPPFMIQPLLDALMKINQKAIDKAAADAAKGTAPAKERDLTVSQIQQAYVDGLIKRADAQNMMRELKPPYSADEVELLLKLADVRIKTPRVVKLKRLPLTDYEKAHKAKLISEEDVLARMRGEYTEADIELEKTLLKVGKA